MTFKSPRGPASGLYANFGVLKFSDMVHLQNILILGKLSRNEIPDAIQSIFAVDFSHTQPTRADNIGLLNLPLVETTSLTKILSDTTLFFPGILSNLCYQPNFLILSYIPFLLSTTTIYHSVYICVVLCVLYCLSCDRPRVVIYGVR